MAGEPDSNYGSFCLSTIQSSSSSISMSLNESDLVEDQPSTSGCSSEQPYTKRLALRKSRKEQVKRYLKELKGLVVQPSGNMGTLSALQQVVDTFKQIKEEKESSSKLAKQENEFNLPFDEQNDLNSVCLNYEDTLYFTLRYPDLNIVAVSKNIADVLGYPEPDRMVGRDICNFVHKKDIVTMNSSMSVHQEMRDPDGLSSDNTEGGGRFQIQKKLFYLRLRKFKALAGGFSLSSKETEFQTFQATVAQQPNVSDTLRTKKNKLSVVLKCVPMRSAYEIGEKVQNMTFSTRHSLFCSYSHIDSKAIPLLGFLPQDIVGMSIFDFYHPDDIELLYGIYQQVVNTETVPFESPPFRFRVHNGDWVYVKTEWSRFVNPWSHRLEFVIGQHTVIKGPTRKNIFSPMLGEDVNVNLSDNLARLKQMIRDLLLKPLVQVQIATPTAHTIEKHRLNEELQLTNPDSPVKEHSIAYVDDSNASSSVSTNRETLTYDHLNYTSNIKRFLLSQKNTIFSPFSEKKSPSSTEDELQESSSCDSVLEVDISIPMPPSFGSSTKVLASEQEREESSTAVFNQLDSDIATLPKNLATVPQSSAPNSPSHMTSKEVEPKVVQQDKGLISLMSLTQEVLWKHTRREETMFLEQAKEDNSQMSFKLNGKRLHSLDPSSDNKWDVIKTIKIEKKPSGETTKRESVSKTIPHAPVGNPFTQPMFVPINNPMGVYQHPGMPFVQVDPANIPIKQNTTAPTDMMSSPSMTSNNMQWPYYPQSVMGGFFQPGNGAFQPISRQNQNVSLQQQRVVPHSMPSTSSSGVSLPVIHFPVPKKGHTVHQTQIYTAPPNDVIKSSLSSSQSSSMEETSSSVLYMLECGSPNRSFTSQEDVDKPKRVEAPPWLNGIYWSSAVRTRYTIPKKKMTKTLEEDREALSRLQQPDLLLSQMAMFEEELDQPPVFDMFDDENFLMGLDRDIDDQTSSIFEDQTDDSSNKTHVPEDADLGTPFVKEDEAFEEETIQNKRKSVESPPGSDDKESLIDDDSCWSKCSDMTPSDERSVEEADSSLKESDESDVGCTAKIFPSRVHDIPLKIVDKWFRKFFAPLPIDFADSKKDGPPWMTNAVVNQYTKMKYCISLKNIEKCLTEDRRKLQYMPQSELVIEQLNSFLEDKESPQFKGPGSILMKSSSQKQRDTYLRVPESLPVSHSGPSSESQRGRYSQIKHSGSTRQTQDLITETLVKYMFPVEPGTSPIPVIAVPSTVSGSANSANATITTQAGGLVESMDF